MGTQGWPGKALKIPAVLGRAAPAGAVAFGVKHTEGVSVDLLFHGRAEPEAVPGAGERWPLEEGTVLRFCMSRASSEVNDNKVRSGTLGMDGWRENFPNNVGFGVRRSPSASMRREGSPSTKPGCSSLASVSPELRESIPVHPRGAGAGMGWQTQLCWLWGVLSPPALAVPRDEVALSPQGSPWTWTRIRTGWWRRTAPTRYPQGTLTPRKIPGLGGP